MSIYGDSCPACKICKRKNAGPNCRNVKHCREYKEWFSLAWGEIRFAAQRIKDKIEKK